MRALGSPRIAALLAGFALPALLVAACSSAPPALPVTEQGRPIHADNERMPGSAPPVASAVTYGRLLRARAEPAHWLTYYGAYDGQRYSALDEINARNVASLKPAWVVQYTPIGLIAGPANFAFEATPIVVDGVMFLTGPDAHV